ncbi:MAG: hypothetical protein OEW09_14550 [Anaerolineae bacterium]|nr:hypothetical protein [Anaerolineae bacterium]
MTNLDLNLLDAIRIAMEAEQKDDRAELACEPYQKQERGGSNGLDHISERDD